LRQPISDVATLTVNEPAASPSIRRCDSLRGDLAQLSASATGTGITYQWRRDGVDLPANSSTYATTEAGSYGVVATRVWDAGSFRNATVTVNQPPLITQDPVRATANVGDAINLSVNASGTGSRINGAKMATTLPAPMPVRSLSLPRRRPMP